MICTDTSPWRFRFRKGASDLAVLSWMDAPTTARPFPDHLSFFITMMGCIYIFAE
jgi:hypothetical protein